MSMIALTACQKPEAKDANQEAADASVNLSETNDLAPEAGDNSRDPSAASSDPAPSQDQEAADATGPEQDAKAQELEEANGKAGSEAVGEEGKDPEANVSNANADENSFDRNEPKLAGIAIGDEQAEVLKQKGKPVETYSMDDASGPISVFEYDGFSVGFDNGDRVLFVEVYSDQTAAGLNGLQIGHKDEDALDRLGPPDASTNFVLSYIADHSMLKLDIDPDSHTIQSMKLFAIE
jgi:hypothetical protein